MYCDSQTYRKKIFRKFLYHHILSAYTRLVFHKPSQAVPSYILGICEWTRLGYSWSIKLRFSRMKNIFLKSIYFKEVDWFMYKCECYKASARTPYSNTIALQQGRANAIPT